MDDKLRLILKENGYEIKSPNMVREIPKLQKHSLTYFWRDLNGLLNSANLSGDRYSIEHYWNRGFRLDENDEDLKLKENKQMSTKQEQKRGEQYETSVVAGIDSSKLKIPYEKDYELKRLLAYKAGETLPMETAPMPPSLGGPGKRPHKKG